MSSPQQLWEPALAVLTPVATWFSVSLARNPTSIPLVTDPEEADSEIYLLANRFLLSNQA
jgi:hypothetical protein